MNAKNPKFAIAPKGEYDDITPSKKYSIITLTKKIDGEIIGFSILDDVGFTLICCVTDCAHLYGKNWILGN